MRGLALLAALLVGVGVALLALAASQGQVQVALVLVVPVIVGQGPWAFLGSLALMAGLFAGFWTWSTRAPPPGMASPAAWTRWDGAADADGEAEARARGPGPERGGAPRGRREVGGFVLLGPIPIAFGSTRGLAWAMLLLALTVLALLLLLPFLAPFVVRASGGGA